MTARPQLRNDDITRQFADAMANAGLRTDAEIISDSVLRRFHVEGDSRNTRNGWYVLHGDGIPAGEYGSWRTGLQATWVANSERLTPAERSDAQARIEARRKERDRQERERQKAAAERAQMLWDEAAEADDTHPYLARKGVPSHGLRVASWPLTNAEGSVFRRIENTLLVPIKNGRGEIISLQGIFPSKQEEIGRDKDFWRDGRKRGADFMIGKLDGGTVAICEGYATGATIHAATGWTVAVAFDAYNLPRVAEAVREFVPQSLIVICADNDRWTLEPIENPGVTKAREAGAAVNARVVVPEFADLDGRPTDFNDLAAREGLDEVKRQLGVLQPALAVPTNDNGRKIDSWEVIARMAEIGVNLSANGRNEPHANLANAIAVLRDHPRFAGRIWYDCFHQDVFTTWDCDDARPWAKADAIKIASVLQSDYGLIKFGDELVAKAAIGIAFDDQRDELRDWLRSLRWDGTPRLDTWLRNTIGAPADEYHDAIGRNFLISMVARGLVPGCKVDTMPIFEGAQGAGKSKMLGILGGKFYADLTADLDTKDFFVVIQGKWLMEVGEMDAFSRADVKRIKQILSSQKDRTRLPYDARAGDLPRRVVFAGSTNEREYLRDSTGARRFWPLNVADIDHAWLQRNREQLFAEAVDAFNAKATWWDVPADAAREQTDDRRETDPWEAPIADWCLGQREVTTSDVLEKAIRMEVAKQGRADQMRVARALTAMGYRSKKARRGSKSIWVWTRDDLDDDSPL